MTHDLSTDTLEALEKDRTPGKWEFEPPWGGWSSGIVDESGECILYSSYNSFEGIQREPDARLCAMAPDLLQGYLRLQAENERLRDVLRKMTKRSDLSDGSEYARGYNHAKWLVERRARAALEATNGQAVTPEKGDG